MSTPRRHAGFQIHSGGPEKGQQELGSWNVIDVPTEVTLKGVSYRTHRQHTSTKFEASILRSPIGEQTLNQIVIGAAATLGACVWLWQGSPSRAQVSIPVTNPQPAPAGSDLQSVTLVFGSKDIEPTRWDGSASISAGRIEKIEGWHFTAAARVNGPPGNVPQALGLCSAKMPSEPLFRLQTKRIFRNLKAEQLGSVTTKSTR